MGGARGATLPDGLRIKRRAPPPAAAQTPSVGAQRQTSSSLFPPRRPRADSVLVSFCLPSLVDIIDIESSIALRTSSSEFHADR